MRGWYAILAIILYPLAIVWPELFFMQRLDRVSALASGLIVFLILWLYALPRDLALSIGGGEVGPRFAVPLVAYLIGLATAAALFSLTRPERDR
jgi:hypothetical protein